MTDWITDRQQWALNPFERLLADAHKAKVNKPLRFVIQLPLDISYRANFRSVHAHSTCGFGLLWQSDRHAPLMGTGIGSRLRRRFRPVNGAVLPGVRLPVPSHSSYSQRHWSTQRWSTDLWHPAASPTPLSFKVHLCHSYANNSLSVETGIHYKYQHISLTALSLHLMHH